MTERENYLRAVQDKERPGVPETHAATGGYAPERRNKYA
jgi:hypothetical protein